MNNEEDVKARDVVVKETEDWGRLWVLDPKKELREYVRCYEVLSRDLRRMPFTCTISSPIIQALNGVSTRERVLRDMRKNPDVLKKGLDTIAETTIDFAKSCIDAGAAGIYLGIGGDGRIWRDLDKKQLEAYALRYDKRILDAVEAPIKLLHCLQRPSL